MSNEPHPLDYDVCDEHEWAGVGDCPKCAEKAMGYPEPGHCRDCGKPLSECGGHY